MSVCMKRFRKWSDTGLDSFVSKNGRTKGTPMGKTGENFREFLSDVKGFEPGAEHYVYTIVLHREAENDLWYYVGKSSGGIDGLKSRFDTHLDCEMVKPVKRNGVEILDSNLSKDDHSYRFIGVERVEPVSVDQGKFIEAHVAERERCMAFEIAAEKQTTRVLGGK